MALDSCLYDGHVIHKRSGRIRHLFKYRVFSCLLRLDELPTLHQRLPLFSYNRFNLFSFYDRDHGARDGTSLSDWLNNSLHEYIDINNCFIYIHCFPRVLGYVFNPLSLYFIYDVNKSLQCVVYEVKNTDGQQHGYAHLIAPTENKLPLRHASDKGFYVSPFMPMTGTYHFMLRPPDKRFSVCIDYQASPDDRLIATQSGKRLALTTATLLRCALRHGIMTVKVIVGIYIEALRLRLKGARFYPLPNPPSRPISVALPEEKS